MFLFNVTKRYESNQKKPQNKIQSNLLNFAQVQEPDKRQGNFTFTPFNLNHPSCYITLKTNIFYIWVKLTPEIKSFLRCLSYNLSK